MNTNRTAVRPARIVAAIAGASLLGGGIACLATGPATAATATPTTLGFGVSAIAATPGGGVIAVGSTWDEESETSVGHAALVADGAVTPLALPDGAEAAGVAVVGDTAYIGGSDVDGAALWTIDLSQAEPVVAAGDAPAWAAVTALATGANGPVLAGVDYTETGENAVALAPDSTVLADNGSPSAVATGTVGGQPATFVIGTDYDSPDSAQSTVLWVAQGGQTHEYPLDGYAESVAFVDGHVLVGERNDDQWGEIVAIDPATGATLDTVAFGTGDQGTAADVRGLAVSGDGKTVYAAAGYGLYAIPAAGFADFDVDDATPIGSDDYLGALALSEHDGATALFGVEGEDTVVAFGAPDAPTGLQHSFPGSTGSVDLTWDSTEVDDLTYTVTVTSSNENAAVPAPMTVVGGNEQWIEGLTPGAPYVFHVTATNGIFTSAEATDAVTMPTELAGPASVTLTGAAVVGSTLTAQPGTGWPAGTTFSYVWGASNGYAGGQVGDGATFKVPADLVGFKLYLTIIGHKDGYADHAASAAPVTVTAASAAPKPLPALPVTSPKKATPKVAGTPRVGRTVTAAVNVKAWPKGTALHYQWAVNGKPIKGATTKHLKLTKKLKGKKVTVLVTGTKAGYAPTVKKSRPFRVK